MIGTGDGPECHHGTGNCQRSFAETWMSSFADYKPHREAPGLHFDGVTIRPAAAGDLVHVSSIAAERDGSCISRWYPVFQKFFARCLDDDGLLLVAELDTQVVGYGRAAYLTHKSDAPANTIPEGWYLTGVVVSPEYRRAGIGLALTQARVDWIANRATTIYYFANVLNRASLDLHSRLGFVELTRDFRAPGVEFSGGTGLLAVLELER